MLREGDRVGVAVSGGADSVVLLHILHRLRFDTTVLHVNHKLRGAESDLDESFVRELSASLGASFISAEARPAEGNLEQEARRARRQLVQHWMRERNLARVALGHTRTDQAETMLFRLFRGSGPAGLSGMRPVTEDGTIRPLLGISRDEVRAWAMQESIPWREDSTNQDLRFRRNRLRLETIPALAVEYNPNLEGLLAGTAELIADEESYWIVEISRLYATIAKRTQLGSFFQIEELNAQPVAVRRRLIRHAVGQVRGDLRLIEREHIEAVLALCGTGQGHDRVMIPGVDAFRSYECLLLTQPGHLSGQGRGYEIPLTLGKEEEIASTGGRILISAVDPESRNCANFKDERDHSFEIAYLDGDVLAGQRSSKPLRVRNWEPGDAIVQPGSQRAIKIKELFGKNRVLLWERRHWPVLAVGNAIVWVRSFGTDERFAASAESRQVLRLVYRSGSGNGS